ncbi:DUF3592 domain-containing protein [Mangrovivirga sp. M17]|uniref:DUF3592 domain-containing protein n=1 Tax=Mangrovivirga halotolerans TaxID=2993936 RepID=A0ABT3RPW4_9BACT|nr:DUF3592 domain-containing protein [Mangrovivirga halotolerans]MCX2743302.1 DUF3592 domain-containing protein [Mangrovivirga halotolerans]
MSPELIITIMSGALIIFGIVLWKENDYLILHGRKTKAIIFKNNYEYSRSGGIYYPVVRFTTKNEEWITQQLNTGFKPALKEGSNIEVIYDPEDPTNVKINNAFLMEILPKIFLAAGIVGFVLGILDYLEVLEIFNFNQ